MVNFQNDPVPKKYIRDGRAPIPDKESTSRVMSANKAENTKPEIMLRKAMVKNGLRGYRLHPKNMPGKPDIAFTKYKIAIFVHGCFWHRCPYCNPPFPKTNTDFWKNKFDSNKVRDDIKKQKLEESGWEVITTWECQINQNVDQCVEFIRSLLMEKSNAQE